MIDYMLKADSREAAEELLKEEGWLVEIEMPDFEGERGGKVKAKEPELVLVPAKGVDLSPPPNDAEWAEGLPIHAKGSHSDDLDEDGMPVFTPGPRIPGWHCNVRLTGPAAEAQQEGKQERSAFEAKMAAGQALTVTRAGKTALRSTKRDGVELLDPSTISTPYRVWQ